jgi:hypothetical protein
MKRILSLVCISLTIALTACGGGGGGGGGDGGSPGTNVLNRNTGGTETLTFTGSPGIAASIAIAQGDEISKSANGIFYEQRFAATVATTSGLPVAGATVALNVQYPRFFKGFFTRDESGEEIRVTAIAAYPCAGEDLNNNDILDAGEDSNQNRVLDPAKALVTASIEGSNLTDSSGNVIILVQYSKAHATWVEYRLNTTVTVTGTEGRAGFLLRTSYAVGDDVVESTPFLRSPYGESSNCTNIN